MCVTERSQLKRWFEVDSCQPGGPVRSCSDSGLVWLCHVLTMTRIRSAARQCRYEERTGGEVDLEITNHICHIEMCRTRLSV